jgi:hypothetical protein
MAIYIPYRDRFIAVQTANEPAPLEVCPGECWVCSDSGCPRDTRFMEDIADAWMLRELRKRKA